MLRARVFCAGRRWWANQSNNPKQQPLVQHNTPADGLTVAPAAAVDRSAHCTLVNGPVGNIDAPAKHSSKPAATVAKRPPGRASHLYLQWWYKA